MVQSTRDDDQRDRAKALYISMPVVRLSTISRRVGARIEQIAEWRDKDDWLGARAEYCASQAQELLKDIPSKKESAKSILWALDKLTPIIEGHVQGRKAVDHSAAEVNQYVDALRKISELQDKQYQRMGIRGKGK